MYHVTVAGETRTSKEDLLEAVAVAGQLAFSVPDVNITGDTEEEEAAIERAIGHLRVTRWYEDDPDDLYDMEA